MTIDFSKETEVNVNDSDMKQISTLAKKQVELEINLEKLNEQVKETTSKLRQVQEEDLPTAMLEAGLSEFKLDTGEAITIKQDIHPSIPKDKTPLAYKWLREHDHGSIIKNNVTVSFGKGEDDKASNLFSHLLDDGYKPNQKESIHFQTLKSFVKETMANPDTDDLPEEFFTVFETRKAMIKSS